MELAVLLPIWVPLEEKTDKAPETQHVASSSNNPLGPQSAFGSSPVQMRTTRGQNFEKCKSLDGTNKLLGFFCQF